MWKRVLVLLLLIPLADALFLVVVADFLGWQVTVLLVVLTALLGLLFVRVEGRRTIRRLHRSLASGKTPTNELLDGGFLIAAAAFLLTPGLVTDAIGFLLILPPSRFVIRSALKRWVIVPYVDSRTGGFATGEVYTFGFPGDGAAGGGTSTHSEDDSEGEEPIDVDRAGESDAADDGPEDQPKSNP